MSAGPAGPATTAQPPVAQPPAAGGVDFTTSDDDLVESPVRKEDTGSGLQETQTRSADELGAGTDTDRPDTRREFDGAAPAGPTARSKLQGSDLPGHGVGTVQPGVDDRREFDAPSDADTATSSVDTIVGSIESHNQGVLHEQAGERSRAAGQKGYADDYETSGNSNALDLIRGNPERGIEPLNADNFRERMAQLPSQLHLGGESVATAELDPSQGHVFTSASPEERAIEQKSLDRSNQARYGQEAEKLRHWAESGYLTVGKTETPEIAVITRPDIQGQVFTDASPQESAVEQKSLERRNAALTRQFEQEVVEAKAQGKVIVLQDPPTPGERMSQAAKVLVPGYGLYKTVQRANHPDSDGGEYVTEREKKAIALEVGMTALDVVPIPVAAAVKPLARGAWTLVDAGGNVLSRIKGDVPNVRLDLFDQRVKVDPKTQLPPVAPAAPESTAYRRFPEQRNLFGERQTPVIEGSGDFSPVLEERVAGAADQTRLDQRFGPEYTPGGAYGHLKSDPDYLANLQAQHDYLGTQPINRSMPGAPAGSPEGMPAGGGNVRSAVSPDLYVAQQTELALPQLTPSTPQPTYLNQFQVQPVSGTRPVLSTAQLRGNIPEAVAGSTPYVQTQSGLYVPAAAVSPDLYAAQQQQTVAAPSTSPVSDAAPYVGTGTVTSLGTETTTDAISDIEVWSQEDTQQQHGNAPEHDTSQQPDPNTGLGGQPEIAPTDRNGTDDETTTGTGEETQPGTGYDVIPHEEEETVPDDETTTGTAEETQPGTGHLPDFGYGVVPHDETLPDDQINTGGQPDLETPNLYDAELATAQQAQTGNLLDLQDATQATQRTDTQTPVEEEPAVKEQLRTVPAPEQPDPKPHLSVGDTMQRRTDEEEEKKRPRPRVEQPVPVDAHPVEEKRPLQAGEYPRHVVHEEVVLDVPSADAHVDRVLVDVSEPRVTAADRTPPPAGEHIAGRRKITAAGQTVYGEQVNPVIPPKDAASQHPTGQVEEAVFVTDLDTGETTVHRYREPRQPGETLGDQLERVSEEERQPGDRCRGTGPGVEIRPGPRGAGRCTCGRGCRRTDRWPGCPKLVGVRPRCLTGECQVRGRPRAGNQGGVTRACKTVHRREQEQGRSGSAQIPGLAPGRGDQGPSGSVRSSEECPEGRPQALILEDYRQGPRITDKDLKKLGGRGKVIIIRE